MIDACTLAPAKQQYSSLQFRKNTNLLCHCAETNAYRLPKTTRSPQKSRWMLRPRWTVSPPLLRANDRGHRPGGGMSVRRPLLAQARSHHPRGRARFRSRPRPKRGGGAGDRGHGVRRILRRGMSRGPALRRHRRPGKQVGHCREVDRERTVRHR
jgi:hypothetical protein